MLGTCPYTFHRLVNKLSIVVRMLEEMSFEEVRMKVKRKELSYRLEKRERCLAGKADGALASSMIMLRL
jgi:hypothetical protein